MSAKVVPKSRLEGCVTTEFKQHHSALSHVFISAAIIGFNIRLQSFFSYMTEFFPFQNNPNKTCHRDRIARLTAPCPSHKKFNIELFANAAAAANANPDADADASAGGSTIALPGLRPGELKI